jgi:hypothetical protein
MTDPRAAAAAGNGPMAVISGSRTRFIEPRTDMAGIARPEA